MGTPQFAVPSLEALIQTADYDIVAVVSQPDRPVGRGQVLTASPVVKTALAHNIPVFQPAKMRMPETEATLRAFKPDIAVVAAYGRILPPNLLAVPPRGCINVHASLLPRHRGAAPIAYSIWKGDLETGIGIMHMEEGLDTGPVYGEARLPIMADDTTATLTPKLAQLGAETLLRLLPRIIAGCGATPQPADGVTHAPPLTKDDGKLDLTASAIALERQVRAMNPWPMASITLGQNRIAIGRAHVVDQHGTGTPGEVLAADKHGVVVACGAQALALDEVQLPGKRMMPSSAWVSGRGIAVGAKFTTTTSSYA